MSWIELLLLILASFRLTHLLVFDSITQPIRDRLAGRPFVGALISCHWCTGIWISGLLVLLQLRWPNPGQVLILLLAVAGGQAIIEEMLQRE